MTLFLLVLDSCRIFNGIKHYVKFKVEWTKIYVLAYVKVCKVLNIYVCFDFISFSSNLFLDLPKCEIRNACPHIWKQGVKMYQITRIRFSEKCIQPKNRWMPSFIKGFDWRFGLLVPAFDIGDVLEIYFH